VTMVWMASTDSLPDFTWLPDIALRTLGGAVIWANDETFAEKDNLISPGPASFQPETFDNISAATIGKLYHAGRAEGGQRGRHRAA